MPLGRLLHVLFPADALNKHMIQSSLYVCVFAAGNTMMIVVESMTNGALDSFLRVRECVFVSVCSADFNILSHQMQNAAIVQ